MEILPQTAEVVDGRLRLTATASGAAAAVALSSDASLAGDLGMAVTLAGQDARFFSLPIVLCPADSPMSRRVCRGD